ncbi:MAG: effector-associated domain EAD1-containing protein [Myxococcota bacterium]
MLPQPDDIPLSVYKDPTKELENVELVENAKLVTRSRSLDADRAEPDFSDTLSSLIHQDEARILLRRIGFPPHRVPGHSGNPSQFWLDVIEQLSSGLIERGLLLLADEALRRYPDNKVFQHHVELYSDLYSRVGGPHQIPPAELEPPPASNRSNFAGTRPPRLETEHPANELASFARNSAERHRLAYKMQLVSVGVVGGMIIGMLGTAVYWITTDRIAYGAVFGAGGVGAAILGKLKWEPFERLTELRRVADSAEFVSLSMRRSMQHIDAIEDPKERLAEERKLVREYISLQ